VRKVNCEAISGGWADRRSPRSTDFGSSFPAAREGLLAALLALERARAGLRVALREVGAWRARSGAVGGVALGDGVAAPSREPRAPSARRSLSASPSSSSRWVWICWRSWSSMALDGSSGWQLGLIVASAGERARAEVQAGF
jgi:hypothetical protein